MKRSSSVIKKDSLPKIKGNSEYLINEFVTPNIVAEEKKEIYSHEDYYLENEVIDVPATDKIIFQFNKPVKLEFS